MSVWTDYDPLEEIIVGNIPTPDYYKSFVSAEVMRVLEPIILETKEDLDNMQKVFESLNVKVYRPEILPFESNLKLPKFKIKNPIAPIVPRDSYIVYGNTIYSAYTSMADRWLESLAFYNIFLEKYTKNSYNWISTPVPLLKDFPPDTQWFTHGGDRYGRDLVNRILWHTATMYKVGDSIIVNSAGPGTALGLDWMKRNIPSTKFINNVNKPHRGWGHIDQFFFMTNDTTCFCTDINYVPEAILKNKNINVHSFGHLITNIDMIQYDHRMTASEGKYSIEWIKEWISEWRGFAQEVAFDSNVVVVDESNIVVSNHQPKLEEFFKSHGIKLHVANQRQGGFWDGGVHCLTLDIKRKGERRNVLD